MGERGGAGDSAPGLANYFTQDYELVAPRHPQEYPMNEGRPVSNKGLDIAVGEYEDHFIEEHVSYSNALHSSLKERGA